MTRSNHRLLAAIAIAAACAAFWFGLLAPKREQAAALAAKISVKQGDLSGREATLAGYRQAQARYERNYAMLARLGKAVPADDDIRSLVVQLDAAAAASKVDFRSIAVGGTGASSPTDSAGAAADSGGQAPPPGAVASATTAGFSVMPFTFSFRGSYPRLSDLFARLERFVTVSNQRVEITGRLLRLESIELKPDGDGYRQLGAKVTASSYLVPEAKGAKSAAAKTPAAVPAASPATTPPTTTATSTGAIR